MPVQCLLGARRSLRPKGNGRQAAVRTSCIPVRTGTPCRHRHASQSESRRSRIGFWPVLCCGRHFVSIVELVGSFGCLSAWLFLGVILTHSLRAVFSGFAIPTHSGLFVLAAARQAADRSVFPPMANNFPFVANAMNNSFSHVKMARWLQGWNRTETDS